MDTTQEKHDALQAEIEDLEASEDNNAQEIARRTKTLKVSHKKPPEEREQDLKELEEMHNSEWSSARNNLHPHHLQGQRC